MVREPILERDIAWLSQPSGRAMRQGRPQPTEADNYQSRLVKFVPGEALAGFLAVSGILSVVQERPALLDWVVFAVLGLAAGILAAQTSVLGGKTSKTLKVALAVSAFAVWVFGMGGPFDQLDWYHPAYGSAAVAVYVILVPALVR